MPRVKGGPRGHRKHVKVLKAASGFIGTRSRLFKKAAEAVLKAGAYAYTGRRLRRRDMRSLWISRINAALTGQDIKYSRFMNALIKQGITLDRKMISEMAINDAPAFASLVEKAKAQISSQAK